MKRHYLPIVFASLTFASQVFGAKTIPNHAIADLVLGQPDFVTGSVGSPVSSFNLQGCSAVIKDPVSGKVFVLDRDRHRILRYPNASSLANGAGAEAVLGQTNFNSAASGTSATTLKTPSSLFLDRLGRLWVAEELNHRVIMFEAAAYRASTTSADRVYGQADFTTGTSGTTDSKMKNPIGVWVDSDDRLWVCEYNNSRVLRFDSITTKSSGSAANGVLGQTDFLTSTNGSTGSKFSGPLGICVSQDGVLFVADGDNNRILRFDNAATLSNGAGATRVLCQPDFTTVSQGTSAVKANRPSGVWITPDDSLWVCDSENSRVIRFNKASTLNNGAAATGVVGQPNFTTNTVTLTSRGLNNPLFQPFVDSSGNLWVPDRGNHRVLRFTPDVKKPVLTVTTKVPKTTSSNKLSVKGTAADTYGISKVQYQVGSGALKTASGTSSWKFTAALASGTNKIKIFAVDSVGNKSTVKSITIKRN